MDFSRLALNSRPVQEPVVFIITCALQLYQYYTRCKCVNKPITIYSVMLVLEGLRRPALAYIVKAINLTNTSIFPAKCNKFPVTVTSVSLRTGSS